jgi:hypothetical protein
VFVAFAPPVAPLPSSKSTVPEHQSSCEASVRGKNLVQRRGIGDLFNTICIRLGTLGSFLYFFRLLAEVALDGAKMAIKFPPRR